MSMKDTYIYKKHASDSFRAAGLGMEQFEGHGTYVPEEDYIPSAALSDLHDLKEGDTFDLGDVTIETFACPGHTLGSMIFLIQ